IHRRARHRTDPDHVKIGIDRMRGDGVAGDQASSELTGAAVYVKCESLQFTNSLKDRGAFVKLVTVMNDQWTR
ncbi:MAG TPA: hypothetical protein VKD00_10175, partial [Methyloceanibacter sp.]|nr:hypothetical protein [Methyloceanibacter sp.]